MLLYQNESVAARRNIPFILVDSTDGYTQRSGIVVVTGNIKISQNGATEANHAGTITEIGGGSYYYQATSGELSTLGYLQARITPSGCRSFNALTQVVAVNPYAVVYYADINYTVDTSNSRDEYTVSWFRNGCPLPSSAISSPTLQVIKRADGTDLIASSSMSFISTAVGTVKKDESTNRLGTGEAGIAVVQAIIDGATQTWRRLFSRDS